MAEEDFLSRQIASKVGCSQSTVIKIVHKKKETGSMVDRDRSGRPCTHVDIAPEPLTSNNFFDQPQADFASTRAGVVGQVPRGRQLFDSASQMPAIGF